MILGLKQKLKHSIVKKVIQKIFNFYSSLETIYSTPLKINNSDRILILAPHADDESIGCGGLLLEYAKQCDVICLTDGRHGDAKIEVDKMIDIRAREFTSVMQKLKVNSFSFLGIEDTKLDSHYKQFLKIDFNNYNYICIPNNLDQHPDHKAVSKHIKKAFFDKIIESKTKILIYEVWGALPLPNIYVDISNKIQEKKDLINMYHSQVKHIDYASKICALNEYRGMTVNKESVESYFVLNVQEFKSIM